MTVRELIKQLSEFPLDSECLGTELPVLQTHDYRVRYYAFEEA